MIRTPHQPRSARRRPVMTIAAVAAMVLSLAAAPAAQAAPSGSISGTVSLHDGTPAKGICLHLEDQAKNDGEPIIYFPGDPARIVGSKFCTNSAGKYSSGSVPTGTYTIVVEDPTTHSILVGNGGLTVPNVQISGAVTRNITLRARAVIKGTVTDRFGVPVHGLTVTAEPVFEGGGTGYKFTSKTDAAGRYSLTVPPHNPASDTGHNLYLTVTVPDAYAYQYAEPGYVSFEAGETTTKDIGLEPAASVTGHLTNEKTGEKLADAYVAFEKRLADGTIFTWYVHPDSNGIYTQMFLPGTYSVSVGANDASGPDDFTVALQGFHRYTGLDCRVIPDGGTARFGPISIVECDQPTGTLIRHDPFPDVTPANVHSENIAWLKQQKITIPADGNYHPSSPVTRAQMTMFLYRLLNPGKAAPVCSKKPFADVTIDNQFCGSIQWASQTGVTMGVTGTHNFDPDGRVNRGQMAAFLKRVGSSEATPACTSAPFTDVSANHQFCGVIRWLSENRITSGVGDGTAFSPNGVVNRDQMASFLHRIYDHINR